VHWQSRISISDNRRSMFCCSITKLLSQYKEKGSGMDKAIASIKLYQLPAINITRQERRTIVILYAYKLSIGHSLCNQKDEKTERIALTISLSVFPYVTAM